jgi:lysozyme family protein
MADFQKSIARVLSHEGGYANIAADSGGETYKGIARIPNPDWIGWREIDNVKKTRTLKRNAFIPEADPYVLAFYKSRFWNPILDQVKDQRAADAILDSLTLHGISGGSVLVQKAINDFPGFKIVVDGKIGKNTIAALNSIGAPFINSLSQKRKEFVANLVERRPKDSIFLKGWNKRFDSYMVPITASIGGLMAMSFFLPSGIA